MNTDGNSNNNANAYNRNEGVAADCEICQLVVNPKRSKPVRSHKERFTHPRQGEENPVMQPARGPFC